MRTALEKPRKQIYSNYTEEDFAVWKLLYEKQMDNLQGRVVDEFKIGLAQLNFNADEIPNKETSTSNSKSSVERVSNPYCFFG